ncbi:MAG TPA: hypothetical protein VF695_02825 [Sphingomonas sp.]|jgi:hypothetical protein
MQTERVTILMTPAKKAALAARAAAQHMSIGQYVRRKVEDEDSLTSAEEAELAMLVQQVNEAAPKMNASIDAMIESVRQTRASIHKTLARLDRPR